MPRRLTAPDPPLADRQVRLLPLGASDRADAVRLVQDEDVLRYTFVPAGAGDAFVRGWIARYESGWTDGTCAGFAIRGAGDGAFLGFAGIVRLDLDAGQGEIGYMVAPEARGRGAATAAVRLLTRWGLDELSLERLELRIDVTNAGSARVAERAGYRLDGVLRSVHFKDGRRCDTGVWSRLPGDKLSV